MTNGEAINWIINISADIGKAEHRDLWHYEQALSEIREMLESAQPDDKDINVPINDTISRQAAIDAIVNRTVTVDTDAQWLSGHARCELEIIDIINALPSAQPEPHEIGYLDCSNALLKMWLDNVLTDGEYKRIADRLSSHAERRDG